MNHEVANAVQQCNADESKDRLMYDLMNISNALHSMFSVKNSILNQLISLNTDWKWLARYDKFSAIKVLSRTKGIKLTEAKKKVDDFVAGDI